MGRSYYSIDSRHGDYGADRVWRFTNPTNLSGSFRGARCLHFQVTRTWYDVDGDFVWTEWTGGPFHLAVSVQGNFSVSRLLAVLKAKMDAASAADGAGDTYTLDWDHETGRVTISTDSATEFTIHASPVATQLGFPAGAGSAADGHGASAAMAQNGPSPSGSNITVAGGNIWLNEHVTEINIHTVQAVLPAGQYEADTLASAVASALTTASAAGPNAWTYTCEYVPETSRLRIDSPDWGNNFNTDFMSFTAGGAWPQLGFTQSGIHTGPFSGDQPLHPSVFYTLSEAAVNWVEENPQAALSAELDGTYSLDGLMDELGAQMTAASSANGSGRQYTVSFDQAAGRVVVSVGGNHSFYFEGSNPGLEPLGFAIGGGSIKAVAVSSEALDISGHTEIYVRTSIEASEVVYNTAQARTANILTIVPVTGSPWDVVRFEPHHPLQVPTSDRLDTLAVRLTDAEGNNIALHGGHWTMVIELDTLPPV